MNADKELKAMKLRLDMGIERNYLIAMARLEGMTPEEYAAKIDAERLAAQQQVTQNYMEQVGAAYRRLQDAMVGAAEAFSRGWNSGK